MTSAFNIFVLDYTSFLAGKINLQNKRRINQVCVVRFVRYNEVDVAHVS